MAFPMQIALTLDERVLKKIVESAKWRDSGKEDDVKPEGPVTKHTIEGDAGLFLLVISAERAVKRFPPRHSITETYELTLRMVARPGAVESYGLQTKRQVTIEEDRIIAASTYLRDTSGIPHHLLPGAEQPTIVQDLYDAACKKLPVR